MICQWCQSSFVARGDAKYCSRRCRQSAFRVRKLVSFAAAGDRSMKLAYADPPYPGLAKKYYSADPRCAEVDHAQLVASLLANYDGWALSTSAAALPYVLSLLQETDIRICAWVKPIGVCSRTFGLHNVWEPLIVKQARRRRGGVPDFLSAMPARGGGDLVGRKPIAFCAWLFKVLGAADGDTFDDIFPGSGIVTRCWATSFTPGSDKTLCVVGG